MESDKSMNSKSKISNTRRKLLIASAATPIVATLHSSSAMAASSAFQCAGGDFSNKKFEDNGNSYDPDGELRSPVPFYKQLSGNEQRDPEIDNEPKLSPNLYLIDDVLYDQDGNDYTYDADAIKILEFRYEEPETAYVLQVYYVDPNGGIPEHVGVWPAVQLSDTNLPLSQSCWTSVSASTKYL